MVRQHFIIAISATLAICIAAMAVKDWLYLQRGYSLGVSLNGEATSLYHVNFPIWRSAAQILLWLAALGALGLFVSDRRYAVTAAWTTFVAVLILGVADIYEYGAIGSPTSKWAIMLLLTLAMVAQFRSHLLPAEV